MSQQSPIQGRFGLTVLTASLALLGCDKPAPTTAPEPVADQASADVGLTDAPASEQTSTPEAAPNDAVAPDPAEGAGDGDGDADPSDPAGDGEDDGTTTPGDEEGGEEGDQQDGDDDQAAKKPAPKKEQFALPRAVHRSVNESCGKGPGVGQKVKSFKLQTPGGRNISPGMFRGRVVLLNFWGTWCKPCLEELPEFDRLYRRYRKHGLSLVAVATDEDPEQVQAFLDKKKIAAKVAIGGEATASAYGAGQFPFTFVVDAQGVIRGSYSGYKPECMGKLEKDIRDQLEALNE